MGNPLRVKGLTTSRFIKKQLKLADCGPLKERNNFYSNQHSGSEKLVILKCSRCTNNHRRPKDGERVIIITIIIIIIIIMMMIIIIINTTYQLLVPETPSSHYCQIRNDPTSLNASPFLSSLDQQNPFCLCLKCIIT